MERLEQMTAFYAHDDFNNKKLSSLAALRKLVVVQIKIHVENALHDIPHPKLTLYDVDSLRWIFSKIHFGAPSTSL